MYYNICTTRIILLIFGSVKIKLTVNYISDNEKTNS